MVLDVKESIANCPIVSVYCSDGIGMVGLCVWTPFAISVYWCVNLVHSRSGQEFACAMLKHGCGGEFSFGVASLFSW